MADQFTDQDIWQAIIDARKWGAANGQNFNMDQLRQLAMDKLGVTPEQWDRATDAQIRQAVTEGMVATPGATVDQVKAKALGADYGVSEEQWNRAMGGYTPPSAPAPAPPAEPPPPMPAVPAPGTPAPGGPAAPPAAPGPGQGAPQPLPAPAPPGGGPLSQIPGTGPLNPATGAPLNPNEGALSEFLKSRNAWQTPLMDRLYDRRLISGWTNPGAPMQPGGGFVPANIQNNVGALTQAQNS